MVKILKRLLKKKKMEFCTGRLSKYNKVELAWFEDEEEGHKKYIGEIKNGLPNGKGKINYLNISNYINNIRCYYNVWRRGRETNPFKL